MRLSDLDSHTLLVIASISSVFLSVMPAQVSIYIYRAEGREYAHWTTRRTHFERQDFLPLPLPAWTLLNAWTHCMHA